MIIFRTSHGAEVRIQSLPQQFNKTIFFFLMRNNSPFLILNHLGSEETGKGKINRKIQVTMGNGSEWLNKHGAWRKQAKDAKHPQAAPI